MHGMSLKNNVFRHLLFRFLSTSFSKNSFLRGKGGKRFAICRMIALMVKKSGPHLLSTTLPVHPPSQPPWEEVCCAAAPLNQHCYNDVSHLTLCSSAHSHWCQGPQWAALYLTHTRGAFWFMGEPGSVMRKLPLSRCQHFHIHQLAHPRTPQSLCRREISHLIFKIKSDEKVLGLIWWNVQQCILESLHPYSYIKINMPDQIIHDLKITNKNK